MTTETIDTKRRGLLAKIAFGAAAVYAAPALLQLNPASASGFSRASGGGRSFSGRRVRQAQPVRNPRPVRQPRRNTGSFS